MVAVGALCVLCGSSAGVDDGYRALARDLGKLLADRGITLVYGGAQVGLMGELADAAMGAGGRVTGVIPVGLFTREVPHTALTELHEVSSMHERKTLMYDLADAFVALPGGLGTLEELSEVATWTTLGLHRKPLVLLDDDGYWDALVAQLDRMVAQGFLRQANREVIQRAHSPTDALARLAATDLTTVERWIGPEDR
jgi:uncharacterized protein (TIGR00730 family)